MSNLQKSLILILVLLVNVLVVLSLFYPDSQLQQEKEVEDTEISKPSSQTRYYRIIKEIYSDHSQSPEKNVGQFITFNGDEAFESDVVGQDVGNGTLKILSSNNGLIEYVGGSYWGSSIKYAFSNNMQTLHIYAKDKIYHARWEEPPAERTTCSYIKTAQSSYVSNNNSIDVQIINNVSDTPRQTHRRQCMVCHGKGWYVHEIYLGSAGASTKQWCNDCGKWVSAGHQHKHCESCHGTGWVEY